jgi:glycosyltransferase involved in cell wall biosynthesis
MSDKIAKIIIAEQPIPSSNNGSWTQRIEHFLKSEINTVDYLICGKSNRRIESKTIFYEVNQMQNRFVRRIIPNIRYKGYIKILNELSLQNSHLIICVIDNVKLKNAISNWIDQKKIKNKVIFLFYNCGFSYFLEEIENKRFLKNCDEMIFLTQSAYSFNKNKYSEFTPEVTIVNNPIDKNQFNVVSRLEKEIVLKKHNLENKIVYLWLSHDREKKGLNIILNAWKDWQDKPENIVLLIVGASRKSASKDIQFLGQIERELVSEYYKLAHVYLFPTLWQEGFGLSLAQAMCSGCFCIAASNGGVTDFFNDENGVLIDNPNCVTEWISNMNFAYQSIREGWVNNDSGSQIMTFDEWALNFNAIFEKWEKRITS